MKPNILFILSDQHNARFLNGNMVDTPNLDNLAAESARFSEAYCQNPLCVPSRAVLLTGRYSKNTGIYDNQHIMESNSPTIPRLFAAAGWRTCLIGKSHLNGEQFQGYQQRPYGDLLGQAHQPDPRRTPEKGEAGLGGIVANAGPSGIPLPLTQTEICVAETAKWLQGHLGTYGNDKPFFLSVHFDKPHCPLNPPEKYFDKYIKRVRLSPRRNEDRKDWVEFVKTQAETYGAVSYDEKAHLRALAAYCGCIEWVDDAVGRILETLRYLGLSDNTIVIYSSDHGEMACEHGFWQKTVFYDAASKIPLFIRWPGHILPGERDCFTGLVDMMPTLLGLAGCPIPDGCDGENLTSCLLENKTPPRDHIYSESVIIKMPEQAGCMLRKGQWKYNYYLHGGDELYNMDADPDERKNLAGNPSFNEVRMQLRSQLIGFWKPEEQVARYLARPRMEKEKHFYFYSNQFIFSDGTLVDARP